MSFDTFSTFRDYLDEQSLILTGQFASTNKGAKNQLNPPARDLRWWSSTGREDGRSLESQNRNRAYLRAYEKAAGNNLSADGIVFGDGSAVWMDKSVIERSLRDELLSFDAVKCSFIFTDAGKKFIS